MTSLESCIFTKSFTGKNPQILSCCQKEEKLGVLESATVNITQLGWYEQ